MLTEPFRLDVSSATYLNLDFSTDDRQVPLEADLCLYQTPVYARPLFKSGHGATFRELR